MSNVKKKKKKKKKNCAHVITVGESIAKQSGNHNHAGDAAAIEAAKAMEKVKEHAMNNRDTQQYIASCASVEIIGAFINCKD